MTKALEEMPDYCETRGMINRRTFQAENGATLFLGNHSAYPRALFAIVRGPRGKVRESAACYGETPEQMARFYGFKI